MPHHLFSSSTKTKVISIDDMYSTICSSIHLPCILSPPALCEVPGRFDDAPRQFASRLKGPWPAVLVAPEECRLFVDQAVAPLAGGPERVRAVGGVPPRLGVAYPALSPLATFGQRRRRQQQQLQQRRRQQQQRDKLRPHLYHYSVKSECKNPYYKGFVQSHVSHCCKVT